MKNKFISFLLTVFIVMIALPTTVFASTDDFMWRIPAMSEEKKATHISEAIDMP